MLFSEDPKRPKVSNTGKITVGRGTLKINKKAGDKTPLTGVVSVGGREVYGAYGVDWWSVMGHLQAWTEAYERGEIQIS